MTDSSSGRIHRAASEDPKGIRISRGFVALIDVLGFARMISGENGEAFLRRYAAAVGAIQGDKSMSGVGFLTFSDTIVLTVQEDSPESLWSITRACAALYYALVRHRIPVRGALTCGSFYRTGSQSRKGTGLIVAGPSIVEAYEYEKIQDWVGIIMSPSLISHYVTDSAAGCYLPKVACHDALEGDWGRLVARANVPFKGHEKPHKAWAVVPVKLSAIPRDDMDNLHGCLLRCREALQGLRDSAPDPSAQAKYDYSIEWLRQLLRDMNRGIRHE